MHNCMRCGKVATIFWGWGQYLCPACYPIQDAIDKANMAVAVATMMADWQTAKGD